MSKFKESNIKVKLTCIFVAFFMWVYVLMEVDPIDTRDLSSIDVPISNISEIKKNNLILSPNQDIKANVKIKGKRSAIAKKVKEGVKLQATIQNVVAGENEIQIKPISETNDITYSITPNKNTVNLENYVTKTEKITIKSIGNLRENTKIDNIKLSKNEVVLSGASSLIQKLVKVEVEVLLTNIDDDIEESIKLKFLDSEDNEISGLYADISEVKINVSVFKEKIVPVTLDIIQDEKNNNENNILDIKIEPEKIKIYGKKSDIENTDSVKTKKINFNELKSNKEIQLDINLDKNIHSAVKSVLVKNNTIQ